MWVIYEGDKWSLKEEMTRGAPQESRVGPLVWNVNESLWRAKRWLDSKGLKMAPEKTKALLVTDRRFFQYPRIVLGEHDRMSSWIVGLALANT